VSSISNVNNTGINSIIELFERWLKSMKCVRYEGVSGECKTVSLLRKALSGFEVVTSTDGYTASIVKGEALKFDFSGNPNIAKFLYELRTFGLNDQKVVLCRPCDARAIVELCKRNQLEREKLVLIGVYSPESCKRRDYCCVRFSDFDVFLFEVEAESNGKIVLVFMKKYVCEADGKDGKMDVRKVLSRFEELEDARVLEPEEFLKLLKSCIEELERVERLLDSYDGSNSDENLKITSYFERCMKCMGCVYECPICICEDVCMVKGIGRGEVPPPPQFLIFRMLHVADSCVNCGQCDDACCANIPISRIFQKVQRKYWRDTGFVPGINYELSPRMR